MSVAYEKSAISTLTNIFYWMHELEDDMKHGVFVLSPSTFIVTWLHDLILTKMAYHNEELDWEQVCAEAKAQALKTWEEEHAKNNG
jgi:hypothetical protein